MAGKGQKPSLPNFGRIIKDARLATLDAATGKSVTQAALGFRTDPQRDDDPKSQKLTEEEEAAYQTFIARLEKGSVSDPSWALLRKLSAELKETPFERLVGELVREKYKLPYEVVSPLLRDPLTLDQLAEWESEQTEMWIVTPDFVDEKRNDFRAAIVKCLDNSGEVIFFLPKYKHSAFERNKTALESMLRDKNNVSKIVMVGLDDDMIALLSANYVISNPTRRKDSDGQIKPTNGYLILNHDGAPYLALRMGIKEIEERLPALQHIRKRTVDNGLDV